MPIIIITSLALLMSIMIVIADTYSVKDSEIIKEYEKMLPGYNCGACQKNSCLGLATAMVDDPSLYLKCRPMRADAKEALLKFLQEKKRL
jgi:electron transport complex protein RnfB